MTGDILGRYRIQRRLGSGGCGEVYLAWDPELERSVAIKLLASVAPGEVERIVGEAKLLATLNHPNIVTIYDVARDPAGPYLVMEYLRGENLGQVLRERRALPVEDEVAILRQVAAGLQHAHARGVVHRDVKPANVQVLPDLRVKLLDFGIARLAGSQATRELAGTVAYMAPEAWEGRFEPRSDIFSCGVVLYELLTGRLPFPSEDWLEVRRLILAGRPQPLAELHGTPYRYLEDVVLRCLARDPEARWPDCTALEQALDARHPESTQPFQRGVTAPAQPIPGVTAEDRRTLSLPRGATGLLPTEAVAAPTPPPAGEIGATQPSPRVRPKLQLTALALLILLLVGGGAALLLRDSGPGGDGQEVELKKPSIASPTTSPTTSPVSVATTSARPQPATAATVPLVPRPITPTVGASRTARLARTPGPIPTVVSTPAPVAWTPAGALVYPYRLAAAHQAGGRKDWCHGDLVLAGDGFAYESRLKPEHALSVRFDRLQDLRVTEPDGRLIVAVRAAGKRHLFELTGGRDSPADAEVERYFRGRQK